MHLFNVRQIIFSSSDILASIKSKQDIKMPPFLFDKESTSLVPLRITRKDVCKLLSISLNQLRKISLADETFPACIKSGTSRHAGVYYDYDEIKNWHFRKLEERE